MSANMLLADTMVIDGIYHMVFEYVVLHQI